MSQDFATYNGKIGAWKGITVYLMDEDAFVTSSHREDLIYAVRPSRKSNIRIGPPIALIIDNESGASIIGSLDYDGNIVEFEIPVVYKKSKVSYKSRGKRDITSESRSDSSLSVDEILTAAMEENIWARVMFEMPKELEEAITRWES